MAEGEAAIVNAIEPGGNEMSIMLRRHGADPDRSDEVGRSAVEIAAKRGDDEAAEARARNDSELLSSIDALAAARTP